jgi:dTDP-4-dehydrorhamnose reductase
VALVTGAAGFLGGHVTRELLRRGAAVVGSSRDGLGLLPGVEPLRLELEDGGAAGAAWVRARRPAQVVHLAAEANADACAREPERAMRVNRDATRALAEAAHEVGASFAFSSTDLAFDGTAAPYAEDAPPTPVGPYMASKVAAEQAVLAVAPGFLVARIALLYGPALGRKGCFTQTFLERLARGEQVPLFTDQHRTPLEVGDCAALLCDLLERGASGLVHLAGPQRVSRYEHGLAMARACGLDEALCLPSRMADLPGLAARPPDVSLRVDRLVALAGRGPLSVAAGCARLAAGT